MYDEPPLTCDSSDRLSLFQLLLPPPPSTMAGHIPMHGGGGMSEDMHSPPPGSEGDYCNDSKRKREFRPQIYIPHLAEKLKSESWERREHFIVLLLNLQFIKGQ